MPMSTLRRFAGDAMAGCRLALLCILFTRSALLADKAQAWGAQGHRVAGDIAEKHLTPAARKAIADIIGPESLATASTWADRKRSDPAPFWQRTAGAYHYVNVNPRTGYRPQDAPSGGDAYTALAGFARDLASPSTSAEQRRLALRFSLHIVQDLHQPLHAGERDDRGGNDVDVTLRGRSSNLHRVWDSGLVAAARRSDRDWGRHLDRRFPETARRTWQQADPLAWIRESAELSRSVYPDSPDLDRRYIDRHRETLERRLAQAGVRSAVYLNRLFDPDLDTPPLPTAPPTLWQRLKDFLQKIIQ